MFNRSHSESEHPVWEHWWPPGHVLGWEHTFVHEIHHLLRAIAGQPEVAPHGQHEVAPHGQHEFAPHGANLEDGYRAAEVCDAIARSSGDGST